MKIELNKRELHNIKLSLNIFNDSLSKIKHKINKDDMDLISLLYTNNLSTIHKIESYLHQDDE